MLQLQRKYSWCLAIALVAALFCLIVFSAYVSGLRLNEVNPRTPEFVEIYNENNDILNLSEWQIRDNSTDNPDSITCYNILNCSLTINASYFLIIGRATNISDITSSQITYFYADDQDIGNGLNDDGDNITLFNSTFLTSFSWNSSEANKSWQFYNSTWQLCNSTPGLINSCPATCVQNWSCTSWGSCINGNKTRTCTDLNSCSNATGKPSESQSCTSNMSIYLELDYNESAENDEEFKVNISAYNLENKLYDIKLYVSFTDNDTIISDTYHDDENKWKSSTYYIAELFEGAGNKTEEIRVRLNHEHDNITGDATIKAKIREAGASSIIAEEEGDITFAEGQNNTGNTAAPSTALASTTTSTSSNTSESVEVISLNNPKNIKSQPSNSYMSKTQAIKEYAIYGFALLCVFVIIYLIIKKV